MSALGTTSRAWNFTQSIGVNSHISWGGGYANPAIVQQSITYLGATHVRDGIPYTGWTLPTYQAIAKTGVKFDILASGPTIDVARDVAQATALNQAVPGSVATMEGANEFNTQSSVFNGANSSGNPAWAQQYGPALYSAVKASPGLNGVTVIAASMANAGPAQIQQEGNLAGFIDSSNWHAYYGNGSQPAAGLQAAVANANSTAPGKPVTITETGYYTAVNAMDWGGGGVTPAVQAVLETNILLDSFRDGVSTTYLYELMDNVANPASTDLESNFGLFLADGTPKPAATAIHNLTSILADTGSNAASFTMASFNGSVTGLPSTGASTVLEKSNGTYDVVVWNEPKVWDQASKSAVTPATLPVVVDLGATYQTVKLFDPLKSSAPLQTLSNVRTVNLSLIADPVIIEVSPGLATTVVPPVTPPVTVPPAALSAGSGPDTLALQVSEDAYQGDAQFTVNVDGKQIGGTMTATASRAAGQVQTVNILGSFGAGSHTATLNFLNDAWGGTASTDRNLYVSSAKMDGTAVPGSTLALMSGGPQSFQFAGAAASGSDTLNLRLSEDAWQGDAQYTVSIDGATIGGVQTVTAAHAAGATQDVVLTGSWGAGEHKIGITFLNDAYGGTASTDRNLYVDQVMYDGRTASGAPATLMWNQTATFTSPAASASTAITLHLAEDAWQGDVQYAIIVDGKPLGSTGTVTALNALGQSQAVNLQAMLAAGTHDIGVSFLNDAWGGTPATDRNLYVKGIDVSGTPVAGASANIVSTSTNHFQFVVPG